MNHKRSIEMKRTSEITLDDTLGAIAKIISFNTESQRSNLELIEWAERYSGDYPVSCKRYYNEEKTKATTCISVGPMVDGGIVLSGHTDVVPVEGQSWIGDPYTLRRDDGKLFGRGTCDMKSFGAIALAHIPLFSSARLSRPIHILLSYDEEITSQGSIPGIEDFGKNLPRPSAVIVGEPTMMKVADCHKSISTYMTTVRGHEAHSSKPTLGANAIAGAADLISELYRYAEFLEGQPDQSGRLDPGYSTISVGTVAGGTARNILAKDCKFLWEFRGLPSVPQDLAKRHLDRYCAEKVLPRLRRFTSDASVDTTVITEVPGLNQDPGSFAEAIALKLSRTHTTVAMPFATEAGQFQVRGFPTVLCGPGNVDQAHQPNEFIAVDQVSACMSFMSALSAELGQ